VHCKIFYNDINSYNDSSFFAILISIVYDYALDSNEVKYFVEMMSIAAGESEFEVDRISGFEACCQAFSPIIFDLNEESGFDEFAKACKSTAEALQKNPKIVENLVSHLHASLQKK